MNQHEILCLQICIIFSFQFYGTRMHSLALAVG